ncbi:hypothetical protein [Streptomyces sp. NPDC001568]|uniref:hypothetical protein n=1 Tax=Streptomyces sp. NPDC001568 TaxID=3364588 RepID=UPI00369ECC92
MLDGFAATLGVRVTVLAELTGVRPSGGHREPAPEVVDTASLIWETRHVTRGQIGELSAYAKVLGGK